MSEDKASVIKAIGTLSTGIAALLLLAVVFYLNSLERTAQAERADLDRNLAVEILKQSVKNQEEAQASAAVRAVSFLHQQAVQIEQAKRIAAAMEKQSLILSHMNAESSARASVIQKILTNEGTRLIDVLKTPPEERQEQ